MNLAEALNTPPELPVKLFAQKRPPKADPDLIIREQTQDGKLMIMVMIPRTRAYYSFTPEQWELLQLFDGEREYREIAETYTQHTGVLWKEEDIRTFAESLGEGEFWYKSPQERNITQWQKLADERRRKTKPKSKYGDLSEISFSAWDPDSYLTSLHAKLPFLFSRTFVLINAALFAWMAYIWIAHWGEIGHDSLEYYNFTHKNFADIVEFWVLAFTISFLHESCHGLACKHTGGEVHRMGFLLIYLSPAFFCDVTEAWVFGSKWQRIATVAAGLWSELLLCVPATALWLVLPPGTFWHDLSYKFVLIAGIAALFINLNPLCKLDGYYLLTEMIAVPELKENSTAFVTAWVQRHIFRLPVDVPFVTWRRRALYVPYAVASGFYSYGLLLVVVTFLYHVLYRYSPEWAFVPALYVAWRIFRSRIRSLGGLMQRLYLDKKDWLHSALTPKRILQLGVPVMLMLFLPFWRESVQARLILEPAARSVVRVEVPGRLVELNAAEGQIISAGAPLVRLRNLSLESEMARVQADYQLAADRMLQAQLHNVDYAPFQYQRDQLSERSRLLRGEASRLTLSSDISGVVTTARPQDLVGSYLTAGKEVVEVDDTSAMQARVFVPENDLRTMNAGSVAWARFEGLVGSYRGMVTSITNAATPIEDGLMEKQYYSGLHAPHFYTAVIRLDNRDGHLKVGMTGIAKIFIARRSLAGLAMRAMGDF